ncbi:MAG TPA: hypothetical protein PLV27_02555 [Anaerolineaceae bacterium]|nr:hypothetical protein [Anaerolineaceae bacterium]
MNKVYKSKGKYCLEPDPYQAARSVKDADVEKLKGNLSLEELRGMITRILIRLERLER